MRVHNGGPTRMKQDSASAYHPVVFTILSSGRASVRNGGHTRMREDIAFAFLGSNAAPGTVVGPILVSLPSNQQRSQFRRPAVSHSPQWWAHSNGGGHCPYPPPSSVRKSISAAVCVHNGRLTRMEKDIASAQYLASGVCYSFVQQSSSPAGQYRAVQLT